MTQHVLLRLHGAVGQHGSLTERRRKIIIIVTERLDGDEVRDRRVPRARHGVVDPGVDPRRARVDAAAAERVDAAAERQQRRLASGLASAPALACVARTTTPRRTART